MMSGGLFDSLEIENARNLTLQQLAGTFIPTALFKRLLTRKHHILFGARGQGKTALLRMLSFEGMCLLANKEPKIKSVLAEKNLFGIYLPTKLEWVQALSSQQGMYGLKTDAAFLWKLNLSSCIAFLSTVRSCLDYYMTYENRLYLERNFCREISKEWRLEVDCGTLLEVANVLKKIGYEWQLMISTCQIKNVNPVKKNGKTINAFSVFSMAAFGPLRRGIDILSALLGISDDAAWMLCIDEAEYMLPEHQRIINAFMRVASKNLFIKIATMPFSYYTLETDIKGAPVVPGHDFEYLHMDNGGADIAEEVGREAHNDDPDGEYRFCEILFRKVMAKYYKGIDWENCTLESMFGKSMLLDAENSSDWSPDSQNMVLLKKYATPKFLARAQKIWALADKTKFKNEISRKIRGSLLLRDEADTRTGNRRSVIYSGAKMLVKCSGGNPRLFIRILNNMFVAAKRDRAASVGISPSRQDRVLTAVAKNFLDQLRSYQNYGPNLFRGVQKTGRYMQYELYGKPLSGDVVSSFSIGDERPHADGFADYEVLRAAIKYGVVSPNDLTKINYGKTSCLTGEYHLAYVFAPLFRLQPRKGKSVPWEKVSNVTLKHVPNRREANQMFFDI